MGPHRGEGGPGRSLGNESEQQKAPSSHELLADAHRGFWWSRKRLTASFNFPPLLCPGEAAVGQLQALHGALPVPDEEHEAGFPVRQRRRHYSLRADAEVKSQHVSVISHRDLMNAMCFLYPAIFAG